MEKTTQTAINLLKEAVQKHNKREMEYNSNPLDRVVRRMSDYRWFKGYLARHFDGCEMGEFVFAKLVADQIHNYEKTSDGCNESYKRSELLKDVLWALGSKYFTTFNIK